MNDRCGKCPLYSTCDKRRLGENAACPGAVSELLKPSAVDNNFKPLYTVSVYETPDKPNKDNE